ncbi:MAG: NUDIX domain-containing protein, partial [Candidatus Saccharimonadales bacterium]
PGESLRAAACRELKEEVGVNVRPQDLRLVHVNQNFLDTPYMNFMFEASDWHGTPMVNEADKVAEVSFFSQTDLPEKCTLGVRVSEQTEFSSDVTYSFVDKTNFQDVMHEKFNLDNWGKA